MSETIKSTAEFLLNNNNFIVGIHANPDGDCFGSACGLCTALERIGKNARILSPMEIPKRLEFLNYADISVYVGIDGYEALKNENCVYITVDVASNHLLDALEPIFIEKNEFVIDHHSGNTVDSKHLYLETEASATGEIVYKIIRELEELTDKTIFDCKCASSVFGAISSDTGCFKYSNVTPKTHIIAAELIKMGAFSADINYRLFDLKSRIQIDVEKMAYENLESFYEGKVSFIYFSDEMMKSIGAKASDTENVCQLGRGIQGVQIAAYMRQKEEGLFKISVRSNNDCDMSVLCASFGIGGGHKKAAGCSIKADTAEKAKKIFLSKVKEYLE